MATYLYRLGGWAFEHRWRVVGAWVVVIALVVASAMAFSGRTSDKFSVPGTESQQAQDLLEQKFPGAGGASARMVFAAPAGAVARRCRHSPTRTGGPTRHAGTPLPSPSRRLPAAVST